MFFFFFFFWGGGVNWKIRFQSCPVTTYYLPLQFFERVLLCGVRAHHEENGRATATGRVTFCAPADLYASEVVRNDALDNLGCVSSGRRVGSWGASADDAQPRFGVGFNGT